MGFTNLVPLTEHELKVTIDQSIAQKVYGEIEAELATLGLQVLKHSSQKLHDKYFDNEQYHLWQQRGYLRCRDVSGERRLTYRSTSGPPLSMSIYEITTPVKSMALILTALGNALGREIPGGSERDDGLLSLGYLGLHEIAEVKNERTVIRTVTADSEVINVKLDNVTYPYSNLPYHQIELVCYTKATLIQLVPIIDMIFDIAGGSCRISPSSKLDTALALKRIFFNLG